MGSQIQKILGSCQTAGLIGTKFGTYVQIHLGMDIRQTNCPSRRKGALGGGGLWGQTLKVWGSCQTAGPIGTGQLWFTSADSSGNGQRLNTSRPSLPQGAFRGLLGGHKFKSLGSCQTAGPIGTKVRTRLRISLGMDIG